MVEKLRPDELAAFKEAFDTFDKNTDGTISTKVRLVEGLLVYNFSSPGAARSHEERRTEPYRVRGPGYDQQCE
jgi:Ca2+-binding EF-hand superfamily protein